VNSGSRTAKTDRGPIILRFQQINSGPRRVPYSCNLGPLRHLIYTYKTLRSKPPKAPWIHFSLTVGSHADTQAAEVLPSVAFPRKPGAIYGTPKPEVRPPPRWSNDPQSLVVYSFLITISSAFNPLFKVLFTFPSQYLFAIGLVAIFSFGWDQPPVLGLQS